MEIKPEEIEDIKVIGHLNGDEVKIIKTSGGFNVAIGKREKHSKKAEALAAGSHRGIVAHQIAKQFKTDFQPAIFKSESEQLEIVTDNTKLLPNHHINFGLELFTLNKNENYDIVLCKHGITLGKYETEVSGDKLLIKSAEFKTKVKNDEIALAFAGAFDKILKKHGLTSVKKKES